MFQESFVNDIWKNIGQDSFDFEHSMDSLHRKQTGTYYTDLELTLAMMKEMIDSLPDEIRNNLFSKTFLEPCVGTGNFVFAYLRICKDLKFTNDQYAELLNNIYVCDINQDALAVYSKNLQQIAEAYFDISLNDEYFATHIGSGLMIDVDAEETRYIPISDVFPAEVVKNGFDFVVTNPPYKNLKAERAHYNTDSQYERDKIKYAEIGKLATNQFPYSSVGTLNLYKMFVEEIVENYLSSKGVASLLIPASILSDKTCSKLRTRLLDTSSLKSLRIIAEESNYVDASQALCAVLLHKGEKSESIYVDGSFSGNMTSGNCVAVSDIIDESTGNAILVLKPEEYETRRVMKKHPLIKDISYIANLRGELDMTINKDSITTDATRFRLFRGRHIGYYQVNDIPEVEYVSEDFVNSTAKKPYILGSRIACQQIVNMAKRRRMSFVVVPSDTVLANSCNFISVADNDEDVDLFFVMGVLNSSVIDWFFKLTSSNNHINNYEIDNFPIPVNCTQKKEISHMVQKLLDSGDMTLADSIDKLVMQAYGLIPTTENKIESTIFNNEVLAQEAFNKDIRYLVEAITDDDCKLLVRGERSSAEIIEKYGTELTKFEHTVFENIIKKYQKISCGEVLNHTSFKLSDLDLEMIKSVPQGGSWKDIPQETVQKSKRLARITQTGGRTTLYGRIDYSKPSYTITTYFNRPGNGTYVHPIHERVLSVREAARFQCFPDEYMFYGNKTDMLKQVGNAVPVLLAYNIGKAIKEKTGCSISVDLFSGAGGMTYGFKRAGIKAVIANDIIENACITLRTNNPEIPVLCGDITLEETKSAIIKAGLEGGADIICGGPPCQGFSLAGWRMENDPRNQLFRHFVDIVSGVNPKVIVFENVEGIMSYQNGETYREIIELFSELGYYTEGRKLMASYYGAPQRRKRVIILCTRKDICVRPSDIFPDYITPNIDRQVTAYDTISDLEQVDCGENASYSKGKSSAMLKYLKNEISIEEFLEAVKDPRGELSAMEDECGEDEETESPNENKETTIKRKTSSKTKLDDGQLSLFDLLTE